MATAYDKVADLLVSRFKVDADKIRPDATFEELEMDSLFLVEFLLTVESDLGVRIGADSATPQDTIELAVQLIDSQLGAVARP
jgi:acyl carrier protein